MLPARDGGHRDRGVLRSRSPYEPRNVTGKPEKNNGRTSKSIRGCCRVDSSIYRYERCRGSSRGLRASLGRDRGSDIGETESTRWGGAVTVSGVLNFNHLYYFHITALEGSVKGAADRLGVTQPTVSEQIRLLERALGLPLFERAPSGLRLTERGREAFEHTTTMFLAGERLANALGHEGSATPITLRVGVSSAVSRTIAADFLTPVLTFEGCQPSVRIGDFTHLLRDIRAHEIDLLICETEPVEAARPNIEIALIHRPLLMAIASPDIEPRENWENLSLLEYRPASAYHWEVDNFLRQRGLRPRVLGELDDAFLMLEAVVRGGFVAFVPESVARPAVKLGRIKILTKIRPESAGVFALHHSADSTDLAKSAVEKLIANAREHFDVEA